MSTIEEIHAMVWDFRRKYGAWWKTPEPADCIRYAFTEAGELMDAWLRTQRPDDARNNDREREIAKELADVVIMLVSKDSENIPRVRKLSSRTKVTIEEIGIYVVLAMKGDLAWNSVSYTSLAFAAVENYSKMEGFDLLSQVSENLDQIRRKHVPEEAW